MKLAKKIVLITGASSGIGEACAYQFAETGARLILAARRTDRIEALAAELRNKYHTEILPLTLDVSDKSQVALALRELPSAWQEIEILVNNAGLALTSDRLQDGDVNNWDIMLNTNVHGLLYVTHAVLPGMVRRKSGHIINIGSVAGRHTYPTGNVYCATKFAVKAINEALRIDLLGTGIRVTEIAPGAVETEFSEVRWQDKRRAKEFYQDFTPLVAADVADAVVYAATRPPHVDIAELVIYPTDQATPNHLHKTGKPAKSLFD